MDRVAVKVGVARGIGDLRRVNVVKRALHRLDDVGHLALGVEVEHRGDTLRDGLCRDDDNGLVLAKRNALLGRHDDVLVVGKNENDLRGGAVYFLYNVGGGRIHGLAAGDYRICTELLKEVCDALARADGNDAVALGGSGNAGFAGFELALYLLNVVG